MMPGGGPVTIRPLPAASTRQAYPVSTAPPGPILKCGRPERSIPGGKTWCGTIGPRIASVPASVRSVSATTTAPSLIRAASTTRPSGTGIGRPSAVAPRRQRRRLRRRSQHRSERNFGFAPRCARGKLLRHSPCRDDRQLLLPGESRRLRRAAGRSGPAGSARRNDLVAAVCRKCRASNG